MACGTRQCRPESSVSLTRRLLSLLSSWTGHCSGGEVWHKNARPHLTDTCRWRLYDSFDAHSQLKITDTYRRYQILMHRLSILRSYQSASSGATRSVTNTMLVWDTGASIGLTPFRSDFIDYLPLDGVNVKDGKYRVRNWNHYVEAAYN